MKKHNVNNRRINALTRLKASRFYPKKRRTEDGWKERKEEEIKTLEARIK